MEWISVKDRLPKEFIACIVATHREVVCAYWVELPAHFRSIDRQDGINPDDVTHWMPLPEPPK